MISGQWRPPYDVHVHPTVFSQPAFPDYALLDSGGGEKLERFGSVVLRRPDPQALWSPARPEQWERADLRFERESDRGGRWVQRDSQAARLAEWPVSWRDATFLIRPTGFKHVGLFPEQSSNWAFLVEQLEQLGRGPRLLNLFGYTGAASVVAAKAGYEVTHVDASKTSISWMQDNLRASGLPEGSLRVLLDEALAFARREVRRGSRYQGILIDPPHYGRGPRGEKWQFEEGIVPLLEAASALLGEQSFLVLSTYAIGFTPLGLSNLLQVLEGGSAVVGELALEAAGGHSLPAGLCARWSRGLSAP